MGHWSVSGLTYLSSVAESKPYRPRTAFGQGALVGIHLSHYGIPVLSDGLIQFLFFCVAPTLQPY